MESKAVATLELFKVSSLKSSGNLTKFLANKSVADSDVVSQNSCKQIWQKGNIADLIKFYDKGIFQMPKKGDQTSSVS